MVCMSETVTGPSFAISPKNTLEGELLSPSARADACSHGHFTAEITIYSMFGTRLLVLAAQACTGRHMVDSLQSEALYSLAHLLKAVESDEWVASGPPLLAGF
jgi:hypothetical protein